ASGAPDSRTASASVAISRSSRRSPFSSILIASPPRPLRGFGGFGQRGAARGASGGAVRHLSDCLRGRDYIFSRGRDSRSARWMGGGDGFGQLLAGEQGGDGDGG